VCPVAARRRDGDRRVILLHVRVLVLYSVGIYINTVILSHFKSSLECDFFGGLLAVVADTIHYFNMDSNKNDPEPP
jgi:hypothetical protein